LISFRQLQALTSLYQEGDTTQTAKPCDQVTCFVMNHFLHNILTSILVLPTSPILDDLRHTVRESFPYWDPKWQGTFTIPALLLFVVNIFFITLGISVAWKQWQLIGLVPLAMFMFYNISNGFARTSGGRYIVPIDWIVIVYFLIGVFQVILLAANALGFRWTLFTERREENLPDQNRTANNFSRIVVTLVILFGLGALVPLAETLHASRYQNLDAAKVLQEHEAQIAKAVGSPEINTFLQIQTLKSRLGEPYIKILHRE
jgi:hypothetical protein